MICWLSNSLSELGFTVNLISLDAQDAQSFYSLDSSVRWKRLGFNPGLFDKLRRARTLARFLKSAGIDTLIGFVISADKTVFAATKLAGVKLIVAERNAPSMYRIRYSSWHRWMSFLLMHFSNRITVQFPGYINGYPRSLHNRIEVIPNPVPVSSQIASPALAGKSGRYVLLAVNRLDNVQKRVACLIRAFAVIERDFPAWDLHIIGDGPEQPALEQLVTDFGLSERIRIISPSSNIFSAYNRAHLFVIPSLWEGFPNALAEALAHGLPAVGFANAEGVSDLIRISGGGWLADGIDDSESLATTLVLAMKDGSERKRRGQKGRYAVAQFSASAQLERWVKLLES